MLFIESSHIYLSNLSSYTFGVFLSIQTNMFFLPGRQVFPSSLSLTQLDKHMYRRAARERGDTGGNSLHFFHCMEFELWSNDRERGEL